MESMFEDPAELLPDLTLGSCAKKFSEEDVRSMSFSEHKRIYRVSWPLWHHFAINPDTTCVWVFWLHGIARQAIDWRPTKETLYEMTCISSCMMGYTDKFMSCRAMWKLCDSPCLHQRLQRGEIRLWSWSQSFARSIWPLLSHSPKSLQISIPRGWTMNSQKICRRPLTCCSNAWSASVQKLGRKYCMRSPCWFNLLSWSLQNSQTGCFTINRQEPSASLLEPYKLWSAATAAAYPSPCQCYRLQIEEMRHLDVPICVDTCLCDLLAAQITHY